MGSAREVWELSRAVLGDKDGMVAVLRAYMDESGVHDGSPVVTVAAWIAKPKTWRDLTKDWNRQKRPIKVFHAVDCANLQEEFRRWSKPDRDALVARLLAVVPAHNISGVVVGIVLRDFETALAEHADLRAMLGTPYTACFHWAIQTVLLQMQRAGFSQSIAFVHEDNDYQTEALQSLQWIKQNVNYAGNDLSIMFGSKARYVPLQVADVLAYEGNKRFRNLQGSPRRAWTAIDPSGGRVIANVYDKSNIPWMIDKLRDIKSRDPEVSLFLSHATAKSGRPS